MSCVLVNAENGYPEDVNHLCFYSQKIQRNLTDLSHYILEQIQVL